MTSIAVAALCGLALSYLLEVIGLIPRVCVSFRRPVSSYFIHAASWFTLFFLFLLLFQRPWFAVLLVACFQLLLLAVNFAKFHSLREPFLFQDFEYFLDLIRHPRLYLPFFGILNAIVGFIAFISLFSAGLYLEASLVADGDSYWLFEAGVTVGMVGCFFLAKLTARSRFKQSEFKPQEDLRALGMVAFFWCYYVAFSRQGALSANLYFEGQAPRKEAGELPDIVAVQSESFFDPRLSYSCVKADVLKEFDTICDESLQFGAVSVPAWGANTVRTECAFLTGLTAKELGIYQFNPYWYLAKQTVPNLVSKLKQSGYRTICVHPYPQGFYMRDRVFPRLGFDQFIDIAEFSDDDKDGQYISDAAVARKVQALLDNSEQLTFVFVITMENHGPLHLESADGTNNNQFYTQMPPSGCEDLTVYLRHLKNADMMIKSLKAGLKQRERESLLCWYGDHVPVMAAVYKKLGEPVHDTPYFIWRSSGQASSAARAGRGMTVSDLAGVLYAEAVASEVEKCEPATATCS